MQIKLIGDALALLGLGTFVLSTQVVKSQLAIEKRLIIMQSLLTQTLEEVKKDK